MLYESELGEFTIAMAGDLILTRRLSVFREDRFLKLRDIFAGSDAGFANLESIIHKYLEGHHNLSGGTYPTTEPELLEDIKWFGINMMSASGTHAFDYGEEGIISEIEYLDKAGLAHAGTGRNLREARSPGYLDTSRGRVALIAASSHFSEWKVAGEQRIDTPGRPGVNPLGFTTSYVLDRDLFETIKKLGSAIGEEAAKERNKNLGHPVKIEGHDTYTFLGKKFVMGDKCAIHTHVNKHDLEANLKQIREARDMADYVLVSLHFHDRGGSVLLTAKHRSELEEPPDFVTEFAHRCIDEGADIFVGHGPQIPMGIEIYKQKPIFYSLGSIVFQVETVRFLPEEAYRRYQLDPEASPSDFIKARYNNDERGHPADPLQWQQVCAVCQYHDGRIGEILLYPLDLGYKKPRSQRGRPLLADEDLGKKIISRVKRLSKAKGTEVSYLQGRGVIRIG